MVKDVLAKLAPKLIEQAPAVVALILILLHQQQQINWLFEKCLT